MDDEILRIIQSIFGAVICVIVKLLYQRNWLMHNNLLWIPFHNTMQFGNGWRNQCFQFYNRYFVDCNCRPICAERFVSIKRAEKLLSITAIFQNSMKESAKYNIRSNNIKNHKSTTLKIAYSIKVTINTTWHANRNYKNRTEKVCIITNSISLHSAVIAEKKWKFGVTAKTLWDGYGVDSWWRRIIYNAKTVREI